MKNNSLDEIWKKINESGRILMSLHSAPDGDSLGSCTAMKYVLERLGKKITLISGDELSESLMAMKLADEVKFGKDILDMKLSEYDLLLCLDTGTPKMIGRFKPAYEAPKDIFIINIDHHPTNEYYGNLNYVSDRQPSACSVLIELFNHGKITFDSELSTRLLLGLCTDSGFFTFTDTADIALEQAAFLVSNGGEYALRVMSPIFHNQPLNLVKYYSLLVLKLRFNYEKKFAYCITTQEEIKRLKLNNADVRLGSNYLQNIVGFDFIFTLADIGKEIKGSFRSQRGVDVSLFAKELGGGGHKAAAAFVLRDMTIGEAEKKVLSAIDKVGVNYSNFE